MRMGKRKASNVKNILEQLNADAFQTESFTEDSRTRKKSHQELIMRLNVVHSSSEEPWRNSNMISESSEAQRKSLWCATELSDKYAETINKGLKPTRVGNEDPSEERESNEEHTAGRRMGTESEEDCIHHPSSDIGNKEAKYQAEPAQGSTAKTATPGNKEVQNRECLMSGQSPCLGSDGCMTIPTLKLASSSSKVPGSDETASKEHENAGSSGKRSREMWQIQEGRDEEAADGDKACKKQRIKWPDDSSQLKMLGPLNLPDFVKDAHLYETLDPEIQAMNVLLAEINRRLQALEPIDDWPKAESSASPPGMDDNMGNKTNPRETRYRNELVIARQHIIVRLLQMNPAFRPQPTDKPSKFQRKLYIPVKQYPGYNFVGLLIGPGGNTQKRMERQTGARIAVRGNGLVKEGAQQKANARHMPMADDDLHVLVEANNEESLDAAVSMVEKLLVPMKEELNEHRKAQLKELSQLKGRSKDTASFAFRGHRRKQYLHQSGHSKVGSGFGASRSRGSGSGKAVHEPMTFSIVTKPEEDTHLTTVFVGFLPVFVDDDGLMDMFSSFGSAVSAYVVRDPDTWSSSTYGFVKFSNPASAFRAVQCMNGQKMNGTPLVVQVMNCPSTPPDNQLQVEDSVKFPVWSMAGCSSVSQQCPSSRVSNYCSPSRIANDAPSKNNAFNPLAQAFAGSMRKDGEMMASQY